MELRRYLAILRRRVLLILLTVGAAVGFTVATTDHHTVYTASSTVYIGANSFSNGGSIDPNLSGDQQAGLARLMKTFAIMIRSSSMASDALETVSVARSAGAVVGETTALPIEDTNILVIGVTDSDPAVAQTLSIALSEAFVKKITEFEPGAKSAEGVLPSAPARIFERAKLPVVPLKTGGVGGIVTAALFALALSCGLVLLVEYLDVTVKSVADAERRLELPVLGVVPLLSLDPSTTLRRPPTASREQIGLVRDA